MQVRWMPHLHVLMRHLADMPVFRQEVLAALLLRCQLYDSWTFAGTAPYQHGDRPPSIVSRGSVSSSQHLHTGTGLLTLCLSVGCATTTRILRLEE
jgi:hypothetical protein